MITCLLTTLKPASELCTIIRNYEIGNDIEPQTAGYTECPFKNRKLLGAEIPKTCYNQ